LSIKFSNFQHQNFKLSDSPMPPAQDEDSRRDPATRPIAPLRCLRCLFL
jgi:hypothetical protein